MKILENYSGHVCLFCGEEIKVQYEEYSEYYECNCEDAKKDREILEEIIALKLTRPEKKFKIDRNFTIERITE